MAAEPSPRRGRCRCRVALGLAVLFDALGAVGLLAGAFLKADVSDLLIYLGGVGIFFSLPWWVFWFVGNLEVPPEELQDDVGLVHHHLDAESLDSWRARRLARLARAFSASFSLPQTSFSSAGSATSAPFSASPSHADRPHAHFAASATEEAPAAAADDPPLGLGTTTRQGRT